MAGYTRQSVADIIANAVIKAAPVNAEFNAIRDAFNNSTGHKHDGTSAEGTYVPLIADLDANNKVVVDTANNRISVYVQVGASSVEQLRIIDGAIVPVTDNDIDLGSSTLEFKNLYIDGSAFIDTLAIHENATVAGTLGVTGLSTLATVDINGGAVDSTTIGASTPASGAFTTVSTSGQATLATADINGGTIDGATIGASSAAAGSFTTVSTSGQATLASADINGGTVDNAVIGGTTAAAITGTTITATAGITGDVTGDVTGNLTGNVTGNVTGDLTGDVTGNITAASGTSTVNNLTVNGTLDVTGTTIANVVDPVNAQDAATKNYVDTSVAAVIDAAPAALDTLNELAAALGDDAAFSTTVTNSIATKLPLAGGTMSGAIAMGDNKVTGVATPTSTADAATKGYTDTQDALKLNLTGGTLTGNIVMGGNKVTSTATPTADDDLTRKAYVDGILGSATAAATSASNAATSETNAATSATNAGNSATAAASSATDAAASYDNFDDRYLGAKASAPTLDNDGDALITGALYWNTSSDSLFIWTGSAWNAAAFDTSDALVSTNNLSDLDDVATARTNLGLATVAATGAYSDLSGTPSLATVATTGAYSDLTGIPTGYGNSDVDTHLNTGTAATGEYLSWNGTDYDWATVPAGYADADVDTHLNTNTATTDQVLTWTGSDYDWVDASAGATGGGTDKIFVENGQVVTTNYTVTATTNAMTTGPIDINSGVTVTVETGGRWVVI